MDVVVGGLLSIGELLATSLVLHWAVRRLPAPVIIGFVVAVLWGGYTWMTVKYPRESFSFFVIYSSCVMALLVAIYFIVPWVLKIFSSPLKVTKGYSS